MHHKVFRVFSGLVLSASLICCTACENMPDSAVKNDSDPTSVNPICISQSVSSSAQNSDSSVCETTMFDDPIFTEMNTSEQPTDTVTDPTQDPDVISGPASHVFAHRGASGEAFEHTFASYDLAIAAGSLFIEQDLVSSAEGTLYIAHDKSPESLTGEKRPFSELTDAEIDALTLPDGSSFLKLKDLFTRYGSEIHYVIELRGPSQLTPLLDMIREFQLEDKVILQSWAFAILHDIEQQMPEAGRLFLTQTQEGLEKALVQPYVQIIAVPTALMTPENCVLVHDAGKRFCVFALNTPTEIRWAILMGVDLYFTDFPANALRLEEEYRK